mmetsp:Transcript_11465/g.31011  ORF Transcript_11465/g.31011 Transcript_11465/m.31011 type:complete len:217 (-) Transcript_11465:813-1463(-)
MSLSSAAAWPCRSALISSALKTSEAPTLQSRQPTQAVWDPSSSSTRSFSKPSKDAIATFSWTNVTWVPFRLSSSSSFLFCETFNSSNASVKASNADPCPSQACILVLSSSNATALMLSACLKESIEEPCPSQVETFAFSSSTVLAQAPSACRRASTTEPCLSQAQILVLNSSKAAVRVPPASVKACIAEPCTSQMEILALKSSKVAARAQSASLKV